MIPLLIGKIITANRLMQNLVLIVITKKIINIKSNQAQTSKKKAQITISSWSFYLGASH